MRKLKFSKKLRLLTPIHFSFVFQKAQKSETLHIILLGRLNQHGYPRIGLIVAKKNVKKSYNRNRIKRLIRESFRLHQYYLPAMDFIILAKRGVDKLNNHTLVKELEKLWHCNHYL